PLGMGLVEIGEYEEGLELCRRGTELGRKLPNVFLLWHNLDHLGRAYEALLELVEARRVYEEALELRGPFGPQYEVFSSIRLCAVAALSEDWEDAYAHALKAHQGRTYFDVLEGLYLPHEVEARGGRGSAGGVLPGGADPENARAEDRGRRAQGGFPICASGAPRALGRNEDATLVATVAWKG